jgi:hypothetical protein
MIFGAKESGKISKIRDNPLFIGNHPELTQNTKNKPKKAGPGTLSPNSPKSHDNPLYRSVFTFKRRYIFPDFNRSFLGIIGNNPRKTANISRFKTVTAIPNGYP